MLAMAHPAVPPPTTTSLYWRSGPSREDVLEKSLRDCSDVDDLVTADDEDSKADESLTKITEDRALVNREDNILNGAAALKYIIIKTINCFSF